METCYLARSTREYASSLNRTRIMSTQWRVGKRVAIIGAGPAGVSTALAFLKSGYDVKLFEKHPEPQPLGGGVLLNVPTLAVLRYYGVEVSERFGSKTEVEFHNNKGKIRAQLPFNEQVERAMGIPGWHYGILRKSAFGKMMELLPEECIIPDHPFCEFAEQDEEILIRFDNGNEVSADILVGADGIQSLVSRQAFGPADLFHIGLRVWLAWCEDFGGLDRSMGVISHSRTVQASYFPMLHDGKPGFEWWVVEPMKENSPRPENTEAYLRQLVKDFADPMPLFPDHTNFETQIFPWDIYNRSSLKQWSKGRIVCIGDAVHPVSPYAAYGMGMGIEDGYFLARKCAGCDLSNMSDVQSAFSSFEKIRVNYVNHQVEFARTLGRRFHLAPAPIAWLRDLVFDNTRLLEKFLKMDYLADQEEMTLQLKELHVSNAG